MPYQLWYFVAAVVAVLALFYALGAFRAREAVTPLAPPTVEDAGQAAAVSNTAA